MKKENKVLKVLEGREDNYIFPFFWQHGEAEEVLREYMKVISEANIGAVCVESRPHPDFVGEKWWKDMDVILDEARKRKMQVWILDDSHFPTGYANGAMAFQPARLKRRSVCCKKYESEDGKISLSRKEIMHPEEYRMSDLETQIAMMFSKEQKRKPQVEFEDDELISLTAVSDAGEKINLMDQVGEKGLDLTLPEGHWIVYQVNTTENRGSHPDYINMLDQESVKVLLDTVYEPHWQHYKDDFGKTIAGFFSDEPELGNGHMYDLHHEMGIGFDVDYPWSEETRECLEKVYGDELGFYLPLMWETEGDEAARAKVRYTYMDIITRLVEKNFSYQLGDWCRNRGVKYIGHMIEDNGQHCRTGSTLGHYFRGLAGEDMAGIDDIGGQVYPQGENDSYERSTFETRDGEFYHYMLGKLADSAAALEPLKKGNSMCEIFGNYGWEEGVVLEKYLADHFLARGINHFVPHAFSAKDFPDPDCPPHFYAHGHNPQYRHFGALMKYMNRASELLSGGYHIAPVAVLYHGEAEWAGKSMPGQKAARVLAESQIDYDFLPQDVFGDPEKFGTEIKKGSLKVNTQNYKAILVPYAQFITEKFAQKIPALVDAGVKVWFVDAYPQGVCSGGAAADICAEEKPWEKAEVVSLEEIPGKLKEKSIEDISISHPNPYIHYRHYCHADGTEIYMVINEGTECYQGEICFAGKSVSRENMVLYDAWENKVIEPEIKDEKLCVSIVPNKSLFVVFASPETAERLRAKAEPEVVAAGEDAAFVQEKWNRSTCRSIEYPVFQHQKRVSVPDKIYEEEEYTLFSGFVRYENQLKAEAGKRYILEITDAWEGVEVFANGRSVGIQIAKSYVYDLTPALKEGINDIAVEVASTLERETNIIPDFFGNRKEIKGKTGITGEIKLYQK